MKLTLKLSSREHTGRYLPHRHTSWPAVVLLCLLTLIMLLAVTRLTLADNTIAVSAIVPYPPVTTAPTITNPAGGQRFFSNPITVGGSCDTNLIVELFDNGVLVGSATCAAGHFSLQLDLSAGTNQLVARQYNLGGLHGPDSNVVTVSYGLPAPAPATAAASGGATTTAPPATGGGSTFLSQLHLQTATAFMGGQAGKRLAWTVTIGGGQAPYALTVNWGDGSVQTVSQPAAGPVTLQHSYRRPGDYSLSIQAADAGGQTAYLQLANVISGSGATTAGQPQYNGSLMIAWPLYGVMLLMVLCFALGERYELFKLRRVSRPQAG